MRPTAEEILARRGAAKAPLPVAPSIRQPVEVRDLSPEKVARRLGLTLPEFETVRERLYARGFPRPDVDTGKTPIEIVDSWRLRRYGRDLPELTPMPQAENDQAKTQQMEPPVDMVERFRASREKQLAEGRSRKRRLGKP